eukprot:m.13535 g.13535  ORF g.13535 m.13535 type:complete len:231 (+) comp3310_c0_seq1:671-1363(+)
MRRCRRARELRSRGTQTRPRSSARGSRRCSLLCKCALRGTSLLQEAPALASALGMGSECVVHKRKMHEAAVKDLGAVVDTLFDHQRDIRKESKTFVKRLEAKRLVAGRTNLERQQAALAATAAAVESTQTHLEEIPAVCAQLDALTAQLADVVAMRSSFEESRAAAAATRSAEISERKEAITADAERRMLQIDEQCEGLIAEFSAKLNPTTSASAGADAAAAADNSPESA